MISSKTEQRRNQLETSMARQLFFGALEVGFFSRRFSVRLDM